MLSPDVIAQVMMSYLDFQVIVHGVLRLVNSYFKHCVDHLHQPTHITLRYKHLPNIFEEREIFKNIMPALRNCVKRHRSVFDRLLFLDMSFIYESSLADSMSFDDMFAPFRRASNLRMIILGNRTLFLSQVVSMFPNLLYIAFNSEVHMNSSIANPLKKILKDANVHRESDIIVLNAQVECGDQLDCLKQLCKYGVPLNSGISFLDIHVQKGNYDCVKYLLDVGIDPNGRPWYRSSALCKAVDNNDYNIAKLLLTYGANPNRNTIFQNYNSVYEKIGPPLHIAVTKGNSDMIELLIQSGADIELKSLRFGHTPIAMINWRNTLNVMPLLIRHGASLRNCRNNGNSFLHIDIYSGRFRQNLLPYIQKYMKEIINEKNDFGVTCLQQNLHSPFIEETLLLEMVQLGADVRHIDDQGNTLLHYWCCTGQHMSFFNNFKESLLKMASKPNKFGLYPIHIYTCNSYNYRDDIIQLLISNGVSMEYQVDISLLLLECQENINNLEKVSTLSLIHYVMLRKLVNFFDGCRITTIDALYLSSLANKIYMLPSILLPELNQRDIYDRHFVHTMSSRTLQTYISEHNYSIEDVMNLTDSFGRTPIFYAVMNLTEYELDDYIRKYSPKMNSSDFMGITPLMLMVKRKSILELTRKITATWLPTENRMEHVSNDGESLLHTAVRYLIDERMTDSSIEVLFIGALRNKGVDTSHKNKEGLTAYDVFKTVHGNRLLCSKKVLSILAKKPINAAKCTKCKKVFKNQTHLKDHLHSCHDHFLSI